MAARVTELKVLNDALGDAGEPRRRIDEDGSLFLRKLGVHARSETRAGES